MIKMYTVFYFFHLPRSRSTRFSASALNSVFLVFPAKRSRGKRFTVSSQQDAMGVHVFCFFPATRPRGTRFSVPSPQDDQGVGTRFPAISGQYAQEVQGILFPKGNQEINGFLLLPRNMIKWYGVFCFFATRG